MDTTTTTSMANPTSKRAISHLPATGYSHASLPSSANCAPGGAPSVVRNFGTAGALSLIGPAMGSSNSSSNNNNNAIYNDFDIGSSLSSALLVKPKPFYDPSDDFLMADGAQWTDGGGDKMPVRPQQDAPPSPVEESLPISTLKLSSSSSSSPDTGQTFIMRGAEKETSAALDLPSDNRITSRFELSPQSSFGVDSYATSVDHSPCISSLPGLNHPEWLHALASAPQVRGADSSCDITGNEAAMVPFSVHTHALQQHKLQQQQQQMLMMMVYKNNSPWQPLQSSSAPELQLRCQGGVPVEDPCSYAVSSYDVNQTSALMAQRKTAAAYPSTSQRLCAICGDEASGCHYGVITCGSCKVFFKRAVEGPHNYLCAGRNDCIVDKIRRKNCPSCRLKNCYLAGMKLGGRKMKRVGSPRTASGFRPPSSSSSALVFQGHHHHHHHPWTAAVASHQGGRDHHHQHQTTLSCALPSPPVVSVTELQLHPQIISLLEDIEPDTVLSEYDSGGGGGGQADVLSNMLLTCLNRLCERQLVWIVRWSKSLPGFRSLHIDDQMTLIQYSWMHLMVFALGWRSFQNVTSEYLYFAPDLVLSQEQMKRSPINELCVAMQQVPQEFRKLQVTREEFLCMKVIILLTTVPLEGLKSQSAFEDMRQNYIRELYKTIYMKENGAAASSQRFYHLTKLMDAMHEIVKKMNLYCLTTFIQADAMKVEFPEMMTEVISTQLPKVLAGMVRPLLFHDNANAGRIA